MGFFPRLYQPGPIEPIVEVGQNLLLQSKAGLDLYQVQYIDTYPVSQPLCVNLATSGLAAATGTAGVSTGSTPISLQNQEDEQNGTVGHFRFFILDPVVVTLSQPQAAGRNANMRSRAAFSLYSRLRDPWDAMTEHFVYEQLRAYLIATNYNAYSVGQARVALYGFEYVLGGAEVKASGAGGTNVTPLARFTSVNDAVQSGFKFTVVPTSAWGG